MDFLHRNANNQSQSVRGNGSGQGSVAAANSDKAKKVVDGEPRWLRVVFIILLFSLTVLAIAISTLFYVGKDTEADYVDENKVQAVFLTNGQVYFGKVKDISHQYVDLQDIYYLNSQSTETDANKQQAAPTSFSLVKLGCELHGPADQMIINREQVSFWENLSKDGKVAKAIDQWRSQNPNGQNCENSETSNSTQQSTGGGNTSTGTTQNQKQEE